MSNDLFFSYASSIDGSGADGHVLVDDSPVDMLKLEKKRRKKKKKEEEEEEEKEEEEGSRRERKNKNNLKQG